MSGASPLEKLQGLFTRRSPDTPGTSMSPEKFRQNLERALGETASGAHLLRVAAQQRIGINIVPGKGASGYIPETRSVFVALPVNLSTVPEETVLELAAFLRQAELQMMGHKNPDKSMTSIEYTIAYDSKMIDSLGTMCKIAMEHYEKGNVKFVDALFRMGHSGIYETYSKYGQGAELVDSYYKLVKKTDV